MDHVSYCDVTRFPVLVAFLSAIESVSEIMFLHSRLYCLIKQTQTSILLYLSVPYTHILAVFQP